MEGFSTNIIYPTLEQVIQVNRRMITMSGGSFTAPNNFHNKESLEYILTAIAFPIFGKIIYSTLIEKAAALGYKIITSHVFLDGNKRTGTYMTWSFLQSNNNPVTLDMSIVKLVEQLAIGEKLQSDFVDWLQDH